jgi:hypothetical protein
MQEIQRNCSIAGSHSTLVIIGGVLDYHEQCNMARTQGLCIERLYGAIAPQRMVGASNSNWHASFADFLQHVGIADWRTGNCQDMASVRFRSSMPRGAHLTTWLAA